MFFFHKVIYIKIGFVVVKDAFVKKNSLLMELVFNDDNALRQIALCY